MNDTPSHPPTDTSPLSIGALFRAGADGELSPADQARLDQHLATHPHDRSRLGFEKGLKSCCCRVMAGSACPDTLRDRVERQVRETPPAVLSPAAARSTSFWSSPRMRQWSGSLAAAVVLFLGIAFVTNLTRYGTSIPTRGEFAQVVSFVAKEHHQCDVDPKREAKFDIINMNDAPGALAGIIGSEPTIPNLEAAGLIFKGAGRCGVPEGGKSAHLRFEAPDPNGGPAHKLSLFVQQRGNDTPDLEEDVAYLLNKQKDVPHNMLVYAWRKDDVIYYLVADKLSACTKFREAVGIPKTIAAR